MRFATVKLALKGRMVDVDTVNQAVLLRYCCSNQCVVTHAVTRAVGAWDRPAGLAEGAAGFLGEASCSTIYNDLYWLGLTSQRFLPLSGVNCTGESVILHILAANGPTFNVLFRLTPKQPKWYQLSSLSCYTESNRYSQTRMVRMCKNVELLLTFWAGVRVLRTGP